MCCQYKVNKWGCPTTHTINSSCIFLHPKILPMNFSIFNLIQEMRTQRPLLVQTQVCSENSDVFI